MDRGSLVVVSLLIVASGAGFRAGGRGLSATKAAAAHARLAARLEAAVDVKTFKFRPDTITVAAGTRVTWTNQDEIEHTVTSGTPEHGDDRFASGTMSAKGAAHAAVFEKPGTYPYYCERHPFMRGAIHVTAK